MSSIQLLGHTLAAHAPRVDENTATPRKFRLITDMSFLYGNSVKDGQNDIEEDYRLDNIDAALPFGLRSASLIFTALANGLEWILIQRSVSYIAHYFNDFYHSGHNKIGPVPKKPKNPV